jgi:hypothetical protein
VALVTLAAPSPRRDPYATWGLCLAFGLAIGEVLAQIVDFAAFDLRIGVLDSSADKGLSGVLSNAVVGAAALAAWLLLLTGGRPGKREATAAVALSAVFVVQVAEPPHRLALVLPFGVAAVAALWRLRPERDRANRLVRAGSAVLVVSFLTHALGSRLVSHLGYASDSWPYQIKALTKHAGELCGWTLVASGLMSMWYAGRLGRSATDVPRADSSASMR